MSEELARQLRVAISLLKGYAEYDRHIGHFDDEAFCRERIAKMDEVLAEFEVESTLEPFPVVESGAYS
ncbi:hypothetical protein [Bradyrhizobium sp. URHD0069]|uniref:hypothetical protein n=1 Tax=Bradyrhizobium sp. URHD0069 TaxID=1380355 RepID=UPI00049837B6|nr:hypothetical protein [Bradyrhizobium sp. URHD0069]